ncbi:hypothetical protein J7L05_08430 [bacterium]|nr:hypothetical protein [bacterium]
MKRISFLMVIFIIVAGAFTGCIAKDPVYDIVIQEVKDSLQEEFSDELAMVEKIIIFENTMKVYMLDEYNSEGLKDFAKAITRIYGERMRDNKKLAQTYHLHIFQKKMIDNKMQMKMIAECRFENGSDKVTVKELGLGEGKYDVY